MGSGTRGAKMLKQKAMSVLFEASDCHTITYTNKRCCFCCFCCLSLSTDDVEAIVPFVNRLAKQFPSAGRHHVEEALRITRNNYSKAQKMLNQIYPSGPSQAVTVTRSSETAGTSPPPIRQQTTPDTFGQVTGMQCIVAGCLSLSLR